MIVFDVSNAYFVWDDSLSGKTCYFADSVMGLVNAVSIQNIMNIGVVVGFGTLEKPFAIFSNGHQFFSAIAYPIDGVGSCYNKAYVHFDWDESLEGRRGLMANSIGQIISLVCRNASPQFIYKTVSNEYPFKDIDGRLYKFAYFDPYYDFRHAFLNGETVEYKWYAEWQPLKHCMFVLPPSHYRLKCESPMYETSPTEVHEGTRPAKKCSKHITPFEKSEDFSSQESDNIPVTYMELARWLSEGRGYCFDTVTGKVLTHFPFNVLAKDCPFNKSRYRLYSWGTDVPISELNIHPKCGLASLFS